MVAGNMGEIENIYIIKSRVLYYHVQCLKGTQP